MLRIQSAALLALLAFIGGCDSEATAEEPGIAVVELFTSEGCSSCPPADRLLARLDAESKKTGRPVHCLSFHVDYWDRLGWKDPAADPGYTKRQDLYSTKLKLGGIYTPQMVVNGTSEFVGSDRELAVKAIAKALAKKPSVGVEAKAVADGANIAVEYKLTGVPAGAVLCVAWTESEANSKPDRGENAGASLRHINVVKDFTSIELKTPFAGKLTLKRRDVKSGIAFAYVQDAAAGAVLGATAVEVKVKAER